MVKPFAGLSYGWLDRHGFSETNAGSIDLAVENQISNGLRSRLGAVAAYDLFAAGPLSRTSLFQNDKPLISLSFVEGEGSVTGYDPG